MASNLETFSSPECGNSNFRPPRHTSSPKLDEFTTNNTLLTLNELNEPKPTTMSTNAGVGSGGSAALNQTNKKDSGGSSRTSPTKPKYNLLTKKTAKSSLQNKTPDEVYNELMDLKKVNSSLCDENASLKNKLRKIGEEQSKRSEMEKTSNNMLVSNLKRKVQRLDESIKEKDNNIKKLQADARVAKHEAKIAVDRQDSITKRGMTGLKENPKLQKTMTNSRSPGSRSAEACSPTKSLLLVDENKQLREKLYKALSIHDPNVIENYKDLSSDELIAQILHLKAEVEVLQKIKTRMDENNQNGVADIEVEKLNSEIHHLKSDRLSYYEESEKKDLEIKNLKEELEQIRKESSGKNRTMYGAIPKVPSQMSQNVETKNKIRSKLEVLKKSSATTTSSFESSAKKTLTISKPKAAAAATSKNLALSAVTPQNGAAASKSKQKITKEVTSPVRNGHSPIVGAAAVAKSKSASSKQSPKASLKHSPKDQNEVEKFRQNVAAKKIQQSWKSHRSDVIENGNKIEDKPAGNKENHNGIEDKPTNGEENCNGVENKMINFEGNGNNDDDELKDLQEAVTTIQSVARGNEVRSDLLCGDAFGETSVETNEITKEETSECTHDSTKDVDDNVTTIQSVARAHHHREEILKTWETNGDAIVVSSTAGDGTNN